MTKGLLLILLAGVMNGSFPLPMRYMRKWAWENTWAVWSVVALLAVPWTLALLTVPRLAEVYAGAGSRALLQAAFFGALWGIAGFLFGLSIEMVGMSLTFAVVNGLSSAIGSWVPMLMLHPGKILTAGGLILSAGVLGVVGGVILCSWAGNRVLSVRLHKRGSGVNCLSKVCRIAASHRVRQYTIQTCRLWKVRKATDKATYTQGEYGIGA
jgi:L-rhamnose-H+ transport protein